MSFACYSWTKTSSTDQDRLERRCDTWQSWSLAKSVVGLWPLTSHAKGLSFLALIQASTLQGCWDLEHWNSPCYLCPPAWETLFTAACTPTFITFKIEKIPSSTWTLLVPCSSHTSARRQQVEERCLYQEQVTVIEWWGSHQCWDILGLCSSTCSARNIWAGTLFHYKEAKSDQKIKR